VCKYGIIEAGVVIRIILRRQIMLRKRIFVVLVLGFAGIARANLVDSNSIIQDGIEYYIQTNKSVYDLGENVEILYRVTNLRDESVTFDFGWYPVYQFWVEKEGEQIWSAIGTRLAVVTKLILMPGESRVFPDDFTPPFIWDMRDKGNLVKLGTYNVIGGLYSVSGYYDYTKVAVSIEIIPEPASILLLALGAVGVRLS
jgi:hypothetical protein